MVVALDLQHCEQLVQAGAGGDTSARQQLVEYLWPFWLNRVRTRKTLRALSQSEDHVHNVVARLVQKLLDQSILEGYGRWRESAGEASFSQWLHRVTDNEVRDYVRAVAGRMTGTQGSDDGPSAKLLLNEFATSPLLEELGIRPPNTELQTARELLQFASQRLPPEQLRALTLWLAGSTDEEIEQQLQAEGGSARALRRAAIARLRREFSPEDDGD